MPILISCQRVQFVFDCLCLSFPHLPLVLTSSSPGEDLPRDYSLPPCPPISHHSLVYLPRNRFILPCFQQAHLPLEERIHVRLDVRVREDVVCVVHWVMVYRCGDPLDSFLNIYAPSYVLCNSTSRFEVVRRCNSMFADIRSQAAALIVIMLQVRSS